MARSLTPDSLEAILHSVMKHASEISSLLTKQLSEHMTSTINQTNANMSKMLEAFSTTVQVMVSQITKTLTDALNEMTRTFMSRMEALEQSFTTRAPITDVVAIKNGLWDVEKERMEKARRSKNVIVSRMPSQLTVDDDRLAQNFIEQNLTVKLDIIHVHCFGKDPANTRLCLTLASSVVSDLISSFRILRLNSDVTVRKAFMNHDLTPAAACAVVPSHSGTCSRPARMPLPMGATHGGTIKSWRSCSRRQGRHAPRQMPVKLRQLEEYTS